MKLSIVVSVYNEEQSLPLFYREIKQVLNEVTWEYELIFVNDGSVDRSLDIIKGFKKENPHTAYISFSRNFGHEAAMIAGIDYAAGDGIICMDSDLQHPPELISEIIKQFESGFDVISMVRTSNEEAGLLRRITSKGFYRILNTISPLHFEDNASDFFAISKRAADVLRKDYREKVRFLRGYVQTIGFNKTTIKYAAHERAAGSSKYSTRKLMKFSYNALCSFSDLPLRFGIYSGFAVGILGLILMIYSIYNKLVYGAPAGYSTLIVVMCFMFFVTLFSIGIIGQYLAILFAEIKDRPIYLVDESVGADDGNS